jgi:hypothetical protein
MTKLKTYKKVDIGKLIEEHISRTKYNFDAIILPPHMNIINIKKITILDREYEVITNYFCPSNEILLVNKEYFKPIIDPSEFVNLTTEELLFIKNHWHLFGKDEWKTNSNLSTKYMEDFSKYRIFNYHHMPFILDIKPIK